MGEHNDATGDKFVVLEAKLEEFINTLNCMADAVEHIKQQQADIIQLVLEQQKKK